MSSISIANKTPNIEVIKFINLLSAIDKKKIIIGVNFFTIAIFPKPKIIRPYKQTLLLIWKG